LHVAIISPYSMSRPGGVQEHARGLAKQLASLGHQVTLFGPELRGEQPDLHGVATVSLGGAVGIPANGSVAPLGIDPRMIVRYDLGLDPADVIHLHEPFLPACLFAMLRRPDNTAVVGTFHATADGFWPYALTAPFLRRVARRFDATTAVSPAARRLVRRYVPLDPEIVPNGVDVAAFESAVPDHFAQELGGRVVLFVGRAEPRKGFAVVARAFSEIAETRPDVHLIATVDAGDIPDDVKPERIHPVGRVDAARRNSLHRASDIVVCPSLAGESFGVVVAEGLAGGSAVIASDIPGYRFAGGDAAMYVEPGNVIAWRDALARLVDDPAERTRLAAAGPDRARGFDWPRVADATLAVYERAVSE
jgi:phosphatidylinositol alpha-mannosyltransferase